MYTIYDFEIEYDSSKDKYYLSKNNGELIKTFYGEWALEEYLKTNWNFTEEQIKELYNSMYEN